MQVFEAWHPWGWVLPELPDGWNTRHVCLQMSQLIILNMIDGGRRRM